jgi:hypothetical protein
MVTPAVASVLQKPGFGCPESEGIITCSLAQLAMAAYPRTLLEAGGVGSIHAIPDTPKSEKTYLLSAYWHCGNDSEPAAGQSTANREPPLALKPLN